jgi:demethylmenaquinone methyltransferase/2-methoxy-6-polyprenyl-1,4-benzoquinol methylase
MSTTTVEVLEEDVLTCSLPDASADFVVSSFGLKTFSEQQLQSLAVEVARMLRPGGCFSFLEISVPRLTLLRWPYLTYLNHVVPFIGRLFLGNPDNYRMLGRYTSAFGDCRGFAACCTQAGLTADLRSFFFGCATGVVGKKPET